MIVPTSSDLSLIPLDDPFHHAVSDLLILPEIHSSRERVHHFDLSEFDHLLQVAQHAHRLSRYLRADARVCARAGLLHDLGAHWFNTLAPCALALRLEESPGVHHAIRAHTLFPVLPRTREAWVVVAADFLTSAQECHFVFRRARARAGAGLRRRLTRPVQFLTPLRSLPARRPSALRFRRLAAN
ncbi:MAG: HD domain-containing protein [Chloroflexota bacterium]